MATTTNGLGAMCSKSYAAASSSPRARWTPEEIHQASGYGAFVRHHFCIDGSAFGLPAMEFKVMDPQQMVLLDLGTQVLGALGMKDTGVFVGIQYQTGPHLSKVNVFSGTGAVCSVAAGRLSFVHGLIGPCLSLDTACSSSLAALHSAVSSSQNGECQFAVAAGANILDK